MTRYFGHIVLYTVTLSVAVYAAGQGQANGGVSAQTNAAVSTDTSGPTALYRLNAGDVIELTFFYNPELNQKVQIRPDGRVSLPLIGEVQLAHKNVPIVINELDEQYKKAGVKTPAINLQIASFANQKIYVGGEVLRPGPIPMPGELTVMDAVMEAGGIKHTGKTTEVVLIRNGGEAGAIRRLISIRAENGTVSEAANTVLLPFDVILVPETKIAQADRWVDQYIRQLSPATLNAGFTYLFGAAVIP